MGQLHFSILFLIRSPHPLDRSGSDLVRLSASFLIRLPEPDDSAFKARLTEIDFGTNSVAFGFNELANDLCASSGEPNENFSRVGLTVALLWERLLSATVTGELKSNEAGYGGG